MVYLVFIVITLGLVIGWVALVEYELRRGVRYAAAHRAHLDAQIERVHFLIEHVDFVSFARDEFGHLMDRVGHTIAEFTLHAVRVAERFLTRIVRSLRTRHAEEESPRETAREFVKQLSEFKGQLRRPEPSDLQ